MQGVGQKPRLMFRSSPFVEALLGFVLISFINLYLYPQDPGLTQAAVHPYWIVILLLASRYGFGAGFGCGFMAAVLYLGGVYLDTPDINLFRYDNLSQWLLPLLFIATGCIMGEIRQIHIREYRDLQRQFEELEYNHGLLESQYDVLRQAKQEVDSRIISQEQTLSTLYDAAQGLQSLEEKDIYPATLNMLEQNLGATACSVYEKQEAELVCAATLGETKEPRNERLPLDDPFVGRAMRERKTISLNQLLPSKEPRPDLLIASPILSADHNSVLGALVVEDMPFLKFNQNSVRMVAMLADWCGASMTNARVHQDVRAKMIIDDIVQCYTAEYLQDRLDQEFMRSRRYRMDLSLIMIQLPELPQGFSEKNEENLLIAFSMSLREKIRKVDLLFLTDVERRFVLLLPNTPKEGAQVVSRNVTEKFQSLYSQQELSGLPPLELEMSVVSLNDAHLEYADMLREGAAELETKELAA